MADFKITPELGRAVAERQAPVSPEARAFIAAQRPGPMPEEEWEALEPVQREAWATKIWPGMQAEAAVARQAWHPSGAWVPAAPSAPDIMGRVGEDVWRPKPATEEDIRRAEAVVASEQEYLRRREDLKKYETAMARKDRAWYDPRGLAKSAMGLPGDVVAAVREGRPLVDVGISEETRKKYAVGEVVPPSMAMALGGGAGTVSTVLRKVPTATRIGQAVLKGFSPVVKTGAVTVTTTGGAALAVGAFEEPKKVDTGLWESVLGRNVGEAQSQVGEFVDPSGRIDVEALVSRVGEDEARVLIASTGYGKPVIDKGIWRKLSPEAQQYYDPTDRVGSEYQKGVLDAYTRGSESLFGPVEGWFEKQWGPVKVLGGGMFQYAVPHQMASRLYEERGPIAFATLVPHFGPTAVHTGLTWKEQSPLGKVAGVGFAVLPYATGPVGQVVGGVGRGVGRVPVVGPIARGVTWAPRQAVGLVGEAVKPLHLEAWAPWRAAYATSEVAGKAGLARTGLGPAGARWGWWPEGIVPAGRMPWRGPTTEAPVPKEMEYIDVEAALAPPRPLTPKELEVAKYGETPLPSDPPSYELKAEPGLRYGQQEFGIEQAYLRGAEPVQPGSPATSPITRYAQPGGMDTSPIAQQVQVNPFFSRFSPFIRRALPTLPRVGAVAPFVFAAAAPVLAGAALVPGGEVTPVQQAEQVAAQMLQGGEITQAQYDQIVQGVEQIQAEQLPQSQEQQQVQQVVEETLTQEQQEEYKATEDAQDEEQTDVTEDVAEDVVVEDEVQEDVVDDVVEEDEFFEEQKTQIEERLAEERRAKAKAGFIPPPFSPFGGGRAAMGFARRGFGRGLSGALGEWEFGPAELYVPGVEGPILPTRKYGAVAKERVGAPRAKRWVGA